MIQNLPAPIRSRKIGCRKANGIPRCREPVRLYGAAFVSAGFLLWTASAQEPVHAVLMYHQASPSAARGSILNYDEVSCVAPGKRQIALTFDASGSADGLSQLLTVLRDASVRCTFFLTGEWIRRYPKDAKQILAGGHEIGDHTWSHPDLTRLSDQEISSEIQRADAAIQVAFGHRARPLFRAPFGARNERVLKVAHAMGYRSIYWSIDSLDAIRPAISSVSIVSNILKQTDETLDGAIVRFNVGTPPTARAMGEILRGLKARDLEPVPVSTLFAVPGKTGY
jgi:peptidoglycan/xylan/chitin deacetylase (PgdA/CDA1 family)